MSYDRNLSKFDPRLWVSLHRQGNRWLRVIPALSHAPSGREGA